MVAREVELPKFGVGTISLIDVYLIESLCKSDLYFPESQYRDFPDGETLALTGCHRARMPDNCLALHCAFPADHNVLRGLDLFSSTLVSD